MKRPTCLQALEPRPMCSLLLSGHATQGGSLHVTCDKDQTRITPEVNKLATPYDHQNDHNHIIFSIAQKVNPGKRERVGFTYFVPWVSDMMISSLSVLCKKERATREEERKRIKPSTTLLSLAEGKGLTVADSKLRRADNSWHRQKRAWHWQSESTPAELAELQGRFLSRVLKYSSPSDKTEFVRKLTSIDTEKREK